MLVSILKRAAWRYPGAAFAALGLIWLLLEPVIGLTGSTIELTYWQLIGAAAILGAVWIVIDGFWVSGFLKPEIRITSSGFDTKIIVKFGDIFEEEGWKAIAVNDFFDSVVDDNLVSARSLHGMMLNRYWAGTIPDWDRQVAEQLSNANGITETRNVGKQDRYGIGTTAAIRNDRNRFLCVALTHTDTATHEVKANSSDLLQAIHGLLLKARSVCSGDPISIPLLGSGLARIGIKSNILVDLILTAIFEETKANKVTDEIRIVLPKQRASEINLATIKQDWN